MIIKKKKYYKNNNYDNQKPRVKSGYNTYNNFNELDKTGTGTGTTDGYNGGSKKYNPNTSNTQTTNSSGKWRK